MVLPIFHSTWRGCCDKKVEELNILCKFGVAFLICIKIQKVLHKNVEEGVNQLEINSFLKRHIFVIK